MIATRAQMKVIFENLKREPCIDCGQRFEPCCMDFDHRPGEFKVSTPGKLLSDEDAFWNEVAKCDLVCACCHRVRTKKRGLSKEALKKSTDFQRRPSVRRKKSVKAKQTFADPKLRQRLREAQKNRRTREANKNGL